MQALMEAVQGRIGMLYGGRKPRLPAGVRAEDVASTLREQVRKVEDRSSAIVFSDVLGEPFAASDRPLDKLLSVLRRSCDAPVHRVALTDERESLQVTRLVVPGLEHHRVGRARIGRRLKQALHDAAMERKGR
jgi:ribosomal protein S12 methylthiotransferase accessory factor YcaO